MIRHGTAGATASSVEMEETDVNQVAVLNRDDTETLFVRTDGTDPVVEGDDSYSVPPGARRVVPVATPDLLVRLIATGAGVKFEMEA